jgi:hypothetical protein
MLPVNHLAGTRCVSVSTGDVRVGAPSGISTSTTRQTKACIGEASQVVELLVPEAPVMRSCSCRPHQPPWRCSPLRSSLRDPVAASLTSAYLLANHHVQGARRTEPFSWLSLPLQRQRPATPPPGRSPTTAPPATGSSSPADARAGAAILTASTTARRPSRLAARHTPDTNAAIRHARAERWALSQAAPVSRLTRDNMKREEQS